MSLSAGRPSKKSTLADMSDKPATVRVNFDLSREEHIRLKIYAAKCGKSVKKVLTELVTDLPA